MAMPAQLGVIGGDFVTNREPCNFGSDGHDFSRSFMASNHRHVGLKVSVMDVQVRTAYSTRIHYNCQSCYGLEMKV